MSEEEIKKILDDHERRIHFLEKMLRSEPDRVKKKISVKEFILSKKPKDDVQRTLVICYYLEKYKDMSNFNAKDVEYGFREAKENVPDNVNYKVIQNIKSGYMMEAKEKKDKFKAWTLTSTGERFVENDLKKD
ncbi:MAG: hypothetical protein L6408_09755 [Nanoarchaeota archaeon]|nr:hypothetical protein [Nanoarchaeota archaeon]